MSEKKLNKKIIIQRFGEMPIPLRLICFISLLAIIFAFGSIVPLSTYRIDGQTVTYSDWWKSGAGIYATALGISLFYSGIGILNKKNWSRYTFPIILIIFSILPPFSNFDETVVHGLWNFLWCMLLIGYLSKSKAVTEYYK